MIIDISREVFSCAVYPGDPSPIKKSLMSIDKGDIVNLTAFSMCAHNGTHIDAPFHFYKDGKTVGEIPLEKFVGPCYVAFFEGEIHKEDIERIYSKAVETSGIEGAKRLLLGGNCSLMEDAASFLADKHIFLFGNESQTIGPENAPAKVHYILLKEEVVLLEGIRLSGVKEGAYMLFAQPLNLGDADGAPCRAILIDGC